MYMCMYITIAYISSIVRVSLWRVADVAILHHCHLTGLYHHPQPLAGCADEVGVARVCVSVLIVAQMYMYMYMYTGCLI